MDKHCWPDMIMLANGERVRVRPIRPDDTQRLQAFVSRLSPRTLYLRTNMHRPARLTDSEAAYLTRVDYRSSMALVALSGEEPGDRIVGVARYASNQALLSRAEMAIVVEDAYQQLGLGSQLCRKIAAYARDQGFTSFVANIAAHNEGICSLIRRAGLPAEFIDAGCGEYQVMIYLTQPKATVVSRPGPVSALWAGWRRHSEAVRALGRELSGRTA